MHPAVVMHALDMGHGAVEGSVPLLVAKTTLPPSGAFFIAVVSIINTTLTAVKLGEVHPGLLLLPGAGMHCHFVQMWALHTTWGSGTACSTPFTSLSTEFVGT